ncbi:hypothetical protein CC80DRAFT_550465 [Byssothecium circinans]|uniref:Uncharacterized protein n=1 Tax=Byssothecium circinans TaxID=147558 RepID=A0A6A5TRU4_9PLEO|nr:hypothetical protein CC80DRAFT_550465 [Byssothecium circinans]
MEPRRHDSALPDSRTQYLGMVYPRRKYGSVPPPPDVLDASPATELELSQEVEYGEDDWLDVTYPHRLELTAVCELHLKPSLVSARYSVSKEAFDLFFPYRDYNTRIPRVEVPYERFKITTLKEKVVRELTKKLPDDATLKTRPLWRWPKGKLRMHMELGLPIPPIATMGVYHPVWSEAPPLSVDPELWSVFGHITAAELMTFLPVYYKYLEYLDRLNEHGGWPDRLVAAFMNRARNAFGPHGIKRSTLSKYHAFRRHNETYHDVPLTRTYIDEWTAVNLRGKETEPPIDYYVWDIATGVCTDKWPKGEDMGLMTEVLHLLKDRPGCRDVVKLSNLGLFMSMCGITKKMRQATMDGVDDRVDEVSCAKHKAELHAWAREFMPPS